MNFKIIFAIIAVVLSMMNSVRCQGSCIQQIVCDNKGNQYSTPCALQAAQQNNPCLKEAPCGAVES